MSIYIINLLTIPIWKIFFQKIRSKKSILWTLSVVLIQCVLIAGLRDVSIGTDTKTYFNLFTYIKNTPVSQAFSYYIETGYFLLNKVVSMFTNNFNILLIAICIIVYRSIYKFIKNYSKNAIMSLFLFITLGYFSSTMNIMRQYIALSFVLLGYNFYLKDNNIKFLLFIVLACFFHTSAILVIPIILMYHIIFSGKIETSILIKVVVSSVLLLITLFAPYFSSILFNNSEYYNYIVDGAGYDTSLISLNLIIKIIMSITYFYLNSKKLFIDKNANLKFFNYLNLISCLMNILSGGLSMFTRLNIYFSVTLIIFIPNIVEEMKIKNKYYLKIFIYIGFFILYYLSLLSGGNDIVPYISVI